MPFFTERKWNCKQSKKRISSLRVHRAVLRRTFSHKQNDGRERDCSCPCRIGTPNRIRTKTRFGKRVSHNASKRGEGRASMTLEAAMVLPLFLFTVLNLFAAVNDMALHVKMQAAMHQTGLELARYAYAYERISQGFPLPQSALADVVFSQTYVREQVENTIGETYFARTGVHGGAEGVSFLQSEILSGDTVTLIASYRMDALFLPSQIASFRMVNRVCLRKWTGYDNAAGAGQADAAQQMVYITEHGEVYHNSRNCYHLNVTIRQTSGEKLDAERNSSGGRYTACELCGDRRQSGVFYVSEDGARYHTTAACSGLKRTVRAIPLSEAGTRSPCHHCGGLG
ncbi:MAG: hypothetical protein HDR15_05035 [Lachnospiraceae bacterium]|nr:hypothetical protein [Lachnospiraceae bacterium]